MKTAFSIWEHRIAPVFDTARQIYLVESDGMRISAEKTHSIARDDPEQTIAWLAEHGVQSLVCGAVSRPLQERLADAGIKVIPFVAGELRQVIQAFSEDKLNRAEYAMPGCCRGRSMRRRKGQATRCAGQRGFRQGRSFGV